MLVTGETGTGKELIARTIHANSPRAAKPFIVVDCASLPETLVESILFGHRKGGPSPARTATGPGLVKLAHGGTLFLDEVGELPLSMQRTFLRVLQEKTFRPVGAPAGRNRATSASSPPPTAAWRSWPGAASSARTCSSA